MGEEERLVGGCGSGFHTGGGLRLSSSSSYSISSYAACGPSAKTLSPVGERTKYIEPFCACIKSSSGGRFGLGGGNGGLFDCGGG